MLMINFNIFRPLPSVKKVVHDVIDTGIEQEDLIDHTWTHLQGIYQFFLQLIS
jgi:serine/threonine-protein phosphatase 2A regulatory subunit B'